MCVSFSIMQYTKKPCSDVSLLCTYQLIKYVPLVYMDSNEGLVFGPLYGLQVSCGHVNQRVEQIQKELVGFRHYAAIISGISQCLLRVSCPYHLYT